MSDPENTGKKGLFRKKVWKYVNYFQGPLSGHGISYFEELTVEYRTIPEITFVAPPLKDNASQDEQASREKLLADAKSMAEARRKARDIIEGLLLRKFKGTALTL